MNCNKLLKIPYSDEDSNVDNVYNKIIQVNLTWKEAELVFPQCKYKTDIRDNLNQHIISAAQGSTSLEEFSLNQASPKIMGKLVDFIVMTPSLKSIAFERTFFNYNMAQQLAWAISKSPSLKELKLSDCVEMDMDSFDVLQQAASQKANFSFYQNVVG